MKEKNIDKYYKPLIFIAEDEPTNLQVLYNILKKRSYRMAAAANGKQALKMIPETRPDLILLDIMMPEMDGFEVCKYLKENPETEEIPVIFLTARVDMVDILKGFDLGAVDYVTKPFNGAELLSRIKTHLELKFAREKLQELNSTKDKLLSIIAHDLRNPLQALLLSVDFLYESYHYCDENRKKDYIHKLYIGIHQISTLLENLLEWSRSQRGVIECRPEKLDIAGMIKENIDLLDVNAKKKDISLVPDVAPGIYAFADRNMVRIVLRNLISNAIKFTYPNGEVVISAAPGNELITISVTDNGVGINPEDIPRLFLIDKQKVTLGTAKEKGSGLGLLLCKEFIEKNEGTIEVTSQPGKGSTFSFTVPTFI